MNYVGQTLLNELKDSDIKVKYGIDNNAEQLHSAVEVDIVTANGELAKVDAVIVTAITFFEEIEEKLLQKMGCPVLSIEDILYEV